jgi:hypothetical protein
MREPGQVNSTRATLEAVTGGWGACVAVGSCEATAFCWA